jgi:hypothetical protein
METLPFPVKLMLLGLLQHLTALQRTAAQFSPARPHTQPLALAPQLATSAMCTALSATRTPQSVPFPTVTPRTFAVLTVLGKTMDYREVPRTALLLFVQAHCQSQQPAPCRTALQHPRMTLALPLVLTATLPLERPHMSAMITASGFNSLVTHHLHALSRTAVTC